MVRKAMMGPDDKGAPHVMAKTNSIGFFSGYYNNGNPGSFLTGSVNWRFIITATYNGCTYNYQNPSYVVIWTPNDNPIDPYYFIGGADVEASFPVLQCQ